VGGFVLSARAILSRHSGARPLRREPGIHNHDSGLWIPGLRPKKGASRNDGFGMDALQRRVRRGVCCGVLRKFPIQISNSQALAFSRRRASWAFIFFSPS
jgi:hypothetical protein